MSTILPFLVVIGHMQVAQPVIIETPELHVEFTPRTPNQMMSFYEARGFPAEMRNLLEKQCFITVGITNTSNTRIWLDLSRWEFSINGKTVTPRPRDSWKERWQAMNIPLSKQSTFRWTLIPDTLDYLPGEREGGNLVLPFTPGYFSLTARFATGKDRQGKTITIKTDKLYCAEDAPVEEGEP
ncbi:MAG TPA: hypothetical protein ENJ11_09605 [Gammaproteobacteria bacterium]|nr:hypothetical protein [Gammaproteobacteria bacterium]